MSRIFDYDQQGRKPHQRLSCWSCDSTEM